MHTTSTTSIKRDWLPPILQMIGLIAGAWLFSQSIEHRITSMEEQLKMHDRIIAQMQSNADIMGQQLRLTEQTLHRLVTLEEFIHGMSPDEAEGFYRRKMREQERRK